MKHAADFLRSQTPPLESEISATNVWFYYWYPLTTPFTEGRWRKTLWIQNRLDKLKENDLVIWDNHYSDRFGHTLEALQNRTKWEEVKLTYFKGKPVWGVFRRLNATPAS